MAALCASLSSCNSDSDGFPEFTAAESVAVTSFSLKADKKVMNHLDSVFFSIDLEHNIIFNADSLPKGSAINKLVPVIAYSSSVTSATIVMTGGETRTGTVDYTASPTDSIDFTGDVELRLTTANNALTKTYKIKVNVHKSVPDSLVWDKTAVSSLPSRMAAPKEQKTVALGDKNICLVKESDDSYTLASSTDLAGGTWSKKAVNPAFTPDVRSLTATTDKLYILSADGALFSSADGQQWTSCPLNANSIIGAFGDRLLLTTGNDNALYWTSYPANAGQSPELLPDDFPSAGYSSFHSFTSKWAVDPIGFLAGGSRNGRVLSATWAFDGDSWAKISNNPLPPLTGATIIPYYNYKQTTTSWIQTEFSVCLCVGGLKEDGTVNDTVYISYDNGVNWAKADRLLQLPKHIAAGYDADVVIRTSPMEGSLSAYWKNVSANKLPAGARIQYNVDGDRVNWDCPYIYLFGGHDADGTLQNAIRRAVLARLTFMPLF